MIHWEDKLYSHKNYLEGAVGLLRSYWALHERMLTAQGNPEEDPQVKEAGVFGDPHGE